MKPVRTPEEGVADVAPGDVVMVGGFGLVGQPLSLVDALSGAAGARDLTIISNNLGEPGRGLGRVLLDGRVSHAIGSFFTSNPDVVQWHTEGRLGLTLMPQGTMAEAIRAGGAGLGGFYVQTAVGTLLAEGQEQREIDGETYLFQRPLKADVALIRAARADELGNLVYSRTARNFNPEMATAARHVIAEVDEIVPVGTLAPEAIVTPHVYVDVLVRCGEHRGPMTSVADTIARRVAGHLSVGEVINLGVGIPTLVADHLPPAARSFCRPRTACWASGRPRRPARSTQTLSTPASCRSASCPAPPTSRARSPSR